MRYNGRYRNDYGDNLQRWHKKRAESGFIGVLIGAAILGIIAGGQWLWEQVSSLF